MEATSTLWYVFKCSLLKVDQRFFSSNGSFFLLLNFGEKRMN